MKFLQMHKALQFLFFMGLILAAVFFNATKPRVMILHSYHPDYPWTRDIDVSIRRATDQWSSYAVTWYYMDTKKHSDKKWLHRASIGARRAIDRFDPDVLIAVDDLAQDLAAKYYVDHDGMDIVFAGVNGQVTSYGYDQASNVTGIFERKPLTAIKEMILTLESGQDKSGEPASVLYLMDPSPSMARDRGFFEAFDWAPLNFTESVVAEDFDDWKRIVRGLEKQGIDYLLIANYRKLPRSAREPVPPAPAEIASWTEANSKVPVIGLNVFNVEDGGTIAVGASPFEQGEVATDMAEKLLKEGVSGQQIPMVINRQFVVALNKNTLKGRYLELPQIYETFARTTATYIEESP